jgi:hypothetical protein
MNAVLMDPDLCLSWLSWRAVLLLLCHGEICLIYLGVSLISMRTEIESLVRHKRADS